MLLHHLAFHLLLLTELLDLDLLVDYLLIDRTFWSRLIILKTFVFKVVILLGLVLNAKSFLEVLLIPVSTQNDKTVWYTVERMFHNKLVRLYLLRAHLSLFEIFQNYNSLLSIALIVLQFKYFGVSNQSFFRLLTLFVQNAQVVPDLIKFRAQSRSLDDCFK